MTQQEFYTLTNYVQAENEHFDFWEMHEDYCNSPLSKEEYCEQWAAEHSMGFEVPGVSAIPNIPQICYQFAVHSVLELHQGGKLQNKHEEILVFDTEEDVETWSYGIMRKLEKRGLTFRGDTKACYMEHIYRIMNENEKMFVFADQYETLV